MSTVANPFGVFTSVAHPIRSIDYFDRLKQSFDVEKTRVQKGTDLTYVEWYNYAVRGHKDLAPAGFSTAIRHVQGVGDYLYVVVRVTNENTGQYHDGIGLAPIDKDKLKGFGGAAPEAFSQAFRRAWALMGMGTYLYMDEDEQLQLFEGGNADTEVGEPGVGEEPGVQRAGTDAGQDVPAAADAPQEDTGKGAPTQAQLDRLKQLGELLAANGLEAQLERFRSRASGNLTGKLAGVLIREMKQTLAKYDVEVPEEDEGK